MNWLTISPEAHVSNAETKRLNMDFQALLRVLSIQFNTLLLILLILLMMIMMMTMMMMVMMTMMTTMMMMTMMTTTMMMMIMIMARISSDDALEIQYIHYVFFDTHPRDDLR
jgi:hypothetical protein